MQDNALVHTVKCIKAWFKECSILILPYPPHLPDLNLIKYLLKKLQELVFELHPELKIHTGVGLSSDEQLDLSKIAISEA